MYWLPGGQFTTHDLQTLNSLLAPCSSPPALLFSPALTSADWDPLGEDCGSNKSNHPTPPHPRTLVPSFHRSIVLSYPRSLGRSKKMKALRQKAIILTIMPGYQHDVKCQKLQQSITASQYLQFYSF